MVEKVIIVKEFKDSIYIILPVFCQDLKKVRLVDSWKSLV